MVCLEKTHNCPKMRHNMVEEKVSIDLAMASTPEPIPANLPPARTAWKLPFSATRFLTHLGKLALIAVLSTGAYFAISHFLVETVEIQGDSMVPTLQESNHYLLNRWVFHNREPQRGDVVVIRDP